MLNEIIAGKNPISPDTAILLDSVLGIPAHVWNDLQRNYDLNCAYIAEQTKIEMESRRLHKYPISLMEEYGWIPKTTTKTDKVKALYSFFCIGRLYNLENSLPIQFRRANRSNVSREAVFTWLRRGEIEANEIETEPFNKGVLCEALLVLRKLTRTTPSVFRPEISKLCAAAGVAVAFIQELPATFIKGAAYWINNQKAAVLICLRYKSNDQLWFSFFHETGHILLHGKRGNFVDLDNDNVPEKDIIKEDEANSFAADLLIPPDAWRKFIQNAPFSKEKITVFADSIGIAPGIVVGRLQREKLLPYSHLNGLKETYRWIIE